MKLKKLAQLVALMGVVGPVVAQEAAPPAMQRVEVTGSSIKRVAKEGALPVQVITFDQAPQAFQALQQGKGAGYVDDEAALLDAVAKAGDGGKAFGLLPERVSTTVVAVGLKKNEPALKAAVNEALTQLEKSGQAEKIFFTWYGPQTRHQYSVRDFKFQDAAAR